MSNEYVTTKKIEELNQSKLSVPENDIDHACKSKTLKILVIDDSKDIREVLSELITIQGHEVVMVSNGRDGLNMIENNAFDLVLLDLLMPEFSGLDVIDSLEKTAMIKLNKIVVMTGSDISTEELSKLTNKGLYMWMRKPIKLNEFLCLLRNI